MTKYKVLLVAGAGRSGSTIIDRVLGEQEGFFSSGELNYFWDAGLKQNSLCTCAVKISECEFWSKVIARVMSEVKPISIDEIIKIKKRVDHRKHTMRVLLGYDKFAGWRREKESYLNILNTFYDSIASVANGHTIIDSSKDPVHALLITQLKNVQPYVMHVVRDPRAVAYSRTRTKRKIAITDRVLFMPKQGVLQSSIKWLLVNVLSEFMLKKKAPYIRVRYEDFIADPDAVISLIHGFIDITPQQGRERMSNSKPYSIGKICHIPLGNPGRFNLKQITLKEDDEWRSNMSFWKKIIVTLMTFPLLLRYGYNLSSK